MKTQSLPLHEPTESEVQHQAYLLWCEGGCREGTALSDWHAAQELLRHRHRHARAWATPRGHTGQKPKVGIR